MSLEAARKSACATGPARHTSGLRTWGFQRTRNLTEELFQPVLALSVERMSFEANTAPHTLTVSWLGLV
jgi:hypothetical protein